jgi:hypothetical protein
MMRRALCLVFIAVSVLGSSGLAAAQAPAMPGTSILSPSIPGTSPSTDAVQTLPAGRSVWTSQDGSTVDLTIDATTGAIFGMFVPGFICGSSTSQTGRPIVGTAMGNALTWTLSLTGCPSVGTWIGHYQTVGTEQQLAVLWTLAIPDSPPGVGSTFTGSALFIRQVQ